MKRGFSMCCALAALLAFSGVDAGVNSRIQYELKAMKAPDTKSIWASDTYGVTAFNGKLYALDNQGKATALKLK